MLVADCQLCHHCRNLAEEGCLLSRFHFMHCRYFLGHVACWNLPWQGLYNNMNNRPQVDSAIHWVNDYPADKS